MNFGSDVASEEVPISPEDGGDSDEVEGTKEDLGERSDKLGRRVNLDDMKECHAVANVHSLRGGVDCVGTGPEGIRRVHEVVVVSLRERKQRSEEFGASCNRAEPRVSLE